jgi:hypothetical protein
MAKKPNLRKIVTEFRKGILDGSEPHRKCFMVCTPLVSYLNLCQIHCKLVRGSVGDHEHVWLELPEGEIIDPTASQFKTPEGTEMPEVFIGAKPEWYVSDEC